MTKKNRAKDELRDKNHTFDGIQEYDNDMPRWWLGMFYVSIVFAVCYLAWYHLPFFPSQTLQEEYEEASATLSVSAEDIRKAQQAESSQFRLETAIQDPDLLALGKEVYDQNCSSCHLAQGQGLVGPNLTDEFWIHGSTVADLRKVIQEGVPAKGMPAWESILGTAKIDASIVYIKSLEGQGVDVPGAKAPEGEPGQLRD